MNIRTLTALASISLASAACMPRIGFAPMSAAGGSRATMYVRGPVTEGRAGDVVELSAWGFTTPEKARVRFGQSTATSIHVVDGWRIEVLVPPGQGRVDVCIENAAGNWILLDAFAYEGSDTTISEPCLTAPDLSGAVARVAAGNRD